MKAFVILGRSLASPPPPDWREQLARMLGAKPRRIGNWAELGMYGALSCLADAGEKQLPPDAQLLLGSRRGTYVPTGQVLEQMQDDLPMPLSFLQTQPSQLLALLAAQMHWRGYAAFIAGGSPQALLQLASAKAGAAGVLLGWVDEMDGGSTLWLRLKPCELDESASQLASAEFMYSPETTYLHMAGNAEQAG